MKREIKDYVNDILLAIEQIEKFTKGMGFVVWKTIKEDIPSIKPLVKKILKDS